MSPNTAKWLKRIGRLLICAIVALPAAFVVTFVMSPFWNWFETASGIESFGHSGPADWCFEVTYGALVLGILVTDAICRRIVRSSVAEAQ